MQTDDLAAWLQQRLPAELLGAAPVIHSYSDEIVVVLRLVPPPEQQGDEATYITQQREASRKLRMQLAKELEKLVRLPVAWGMRVGDAEVLFTTRTVPVMTRLGRAERDVLDTLVAAGVAETRSSALAYVVRAFASEHSAWLGDVNQAIAEVHRVRSQLTLHPLQGAPKTTQTASPRAKASPDNA